MLLSVHLLVMTYLALATHVSSQSCNAPLFGRPAPADCTAILRELPSYDPSWETTHLFAEPQLLNPPFKEVVDTLRTGIIQVPKIWTFSESSVTL